MLCLIRCDRWQGRFFHRPGREGWVEEISAARKGHDRLYNVRVFLGMVLRDIQTVFVLLSVSFCSAGRKTVPSIWSIPLQGIASAIFLPDLRIFREEYPADTDVIHRHATIVCHIQVCVHSNRQCIDNVFQLSWWCLLCSRIYYTIPCLFLKIMSGTVYW